MASIRPHVPAHLRARDAAEQESAEAGPSIGPLVPPAAQMPVAAIITPRYEEEEEDEDEDVYVPELPPDLAAARANPSAAAAPPPAPPRRRPIGPAARGPLRREEEEEESEEEEEIGPAPLPSGPSSYVHEDAVIEFMQKEAQRRLAIEVRCAVLIDVFCLCPRLAGSLVLRLCVFWCGALCVVYCACTRLVSFVVLTSASSLSSTGGSAPQDASA